MTEKYGRINFASDDGYNCCGQCVLFNIEEGRVDVPKYAREMNFPSFASRADQYADFVARVTERLADETAEYNRNEDEDDMVDCCFGFMSMTLIKGPKPQIPGFLELLLDDGWQCDQEVVNPKTNNTIVHLSKAL